MASSALRLGSLLLIVAIFGIGCRAPFAKHPDRKYVPATRNAPGSPDTLYGRLGGEAGIRALVDDFVGRVAADPKANFARKASAHEWAAIPQNITNLKIHLVQFLSGATGGPSHYEGRDMLSVHQGMQITHAQFDAFIADLKLSLGQLHVGDREQTDLLGIVEAMRSEIVEESPGK